MRAGEMAASGSPAGVPVEIAGCQRQVTSACPLSLDEIKREVSRRDDELPLVAPTHDGKRRWLSLPAVGSASAALNLYHLICPFGDDGDEIGLAVR
ncbi:MAG: hypothetical protein ACLQUT_10480 [Thermoleophilia bacterium]